MALSESGATEAAVREELGRVLDSPEFAQSESLKRFLRHVVEAKLEGKDDELKEILLGSQVFDRGGEYDPRLDPIVRVQATRLRGKLRDYYHERGADDDVVIDLPKGSYVPVFRARGKTTVEGPSMPATRGKWVLGGVAIAALLLLAGIFRPLLRPAPDIEVRSDVQSLVVLPFTDMTPEGDHGYYGDGIAEEITTTLAGAEGLRVVPRTTAFAYRQQDLEAMVSALNVDAVLQGSVRRSGDTLRIAAQLISARDGRQIWAESYDEIDEDPFRVQDGIARSVARSIEKELGVATADVPQPAAYENVLRARYELSRTTPGSLRRAIVLFGDAIEDDPDYASAYAGLVQAHVVSVLGGVEPPNEAREPAREAAEAALVLEGDHEEALAAAAAYSLIYQWDLPRAQELLDRAEVGGIRSEWIHTMQGLVFAAQNRLDDAAAELADARTLAPNAPFLRYASANVSFFRGRSDEALATLSALQELAPEYLLTPILQSRILAGRGEIDEAFDAVSRLERLARGDAVWALAAGGGVAAHAGRREEALDIVRSLREHDGYVAPALIARLLVALGDHEGALDELERARGNRSLPVLTLASDPDFDPLRDEPRFRVLLDAIGVS